MRLDEEGVHAGFVVRDRDGKFTRDFDGCSGPKASG